MTDLAHWVSTHPAEAQANLLQLLAALTALVAALRGLVPALRWLADRTASKADDAAVGAVSGALDWAANALAFLGQHVPHVSPGTRWVRGKLPPSSADARRASQPPAARPTDPG